MNYKIYQMKFEDGSVYIGQTKQSLKRRMNSHKYHRTNRKVKQRLDNEMPCQVSVVAEATSKERADKLEGETILQRHNNGNKVLNYYVEFKNYPRRYINKPDWQLEKLHCHVCDLYKLRTEFYPSKTRFTGRDSKCQECRILINTHRRDTALPQWCFQDIVKNLSRSLVSDPAGVAV